MLPKSQRLKRPGDFGITVRHGSRAATPTVVVHVRHLQHNPPEFTRVGFVVSKKVGDAVTRNRVKRRLRHLALEMTSPFPTDVVVRALPGAAVDPGRVAADFADAWTRAFRKAGA